MWQLYTAEYFWSLLHRTVGKSILDISMKVRYSITCSFQSIADAVGIVHHISILYNQIKFISHNSKESDIEDVHV